MGEAGPAHQHVSHPSPLGLHRLSLCPRRSCLPSYLASWSFHPSRRDCQRRCLHGPPCPRPQLWPSCQERQVVADRPGLHRGHWRPVQEGGTDHQRQEQQELEKLDRCRSNCMKYKNPWAAPGQAPTLGGGCGVFGGNPNGCPWGKDDRPAGSQCGQDEPLGRGGRGTSSFGTDARFYDFPDMITTEWEIGSVQEVAWSSKGGHRGGYTYRLCKMPKGGRTAITEDCFTKNVLEFATNFTMIKAIKNGKSEKGWEQFDQVDLREGTYPEGSVWRPVGRYAYPLALRMDSVIIPANLKRGEYVLGFRWDGSGGNQVWVSCASIKLVKSAAGRSDDNEDDDDDYSLYTADDYEELEQAFEYTRSADDDDDDDDYSLYTDEDYEELEQAFESTRADEDEDDYDDYSLYSDEDYDELEQNFQNY